MIGEEHDIRLIANPRYATFGWGNVEHLKDVTHFKLPGHSVTGFNPCNSPKYANETATACIVEDVVIAIRNTPVRRKRREPGCGCGLWRGFSVGWCWRCWLRFC